MRRKYHRAMPIYEFVCEACGARFEDLVAAGTGPVACAECGSARTRRLYSAQAATPKLVKTPAEMRKQERANARLRERTRQRFKEARSRARARRNRARPGGTGPGA